MKTKFFKIVLPAFIIMMAVLSAYAFKSVEDKALLAPETGWLAIPGNPCSISVTCENINTNLTCKALFNGVEYDVLGKHQPSDMVCTKILYRIP
jgi:hypothetical protein